MIEEVPIVDTEESAAVVPEPIVVKKRGRPKGAPNKPKVVPNPPKAQKKQPAAPPSESEEEPVPEKTKKKRVKAPPPSSSDEEPVPKKPRRSRQRTLSPTPVMDTRQVASEVLQLLSNRHVNQATARREKYRSWFPAN